MKKNKKLLALFLALALSVAALAMPVAATNYDEASTYGLERPTTCPRCGSAATLLKTEGPDTYIEDMVCTRNSNKHAHAVERGYRDFDCPACGSFRNYIYNDLGCITVSIP